MLEMMPLMIWLIIIVVIISMIMSYAYLIPAKKDKWRDPIKKLYKEQKKSAYMNRILRVRFVNCTGDINRIGFTWGRYYGSIDDRRMKQVFIRSRFLKRKFWLIIPNELCYDVTGITYTIECLGFVKTDMWWIPILTKKYENKQTELESQIDDYVQLMATRLLGIQLIETNITSSIKATKTPEQAQKRFFKRTEKEDNQGVNIFDNQDNED